MTFTTLHRDLVRRSRGARLGWSVLLALALGPAALAAQQGGQKIAVLNSRAVLLATPGYAQAESTFTREREAARQELEKLQASLDSAAADFDQKSVMLSPSARTSRRKELEEQRNRLEQRANELQDRLAQRERELIEPIHNRVSEVIEGVRSEGNYALIFDVNANTGLIVAVDKALDVTQKVIERIKARP
jgi:outer membrane protein